MEKISNEKLNKELQKLLFKNALMEAETELIAEEYANSDTIIETTVEYDKLMKCLLQKAKKGSKQSKIFSFYNKSSGYKGIISVAACMFIILGTAFSSAFIINEELKASASNIMIKNKDFRSVSLVYPQGDYPIFGKHFKLDYIPSGYSFNSINGTNDGYSIKYNNEEKTISFVYKVISYNDELDSIATEYKSIVIDDTNVIESRNKYTDEKGYYWYKDGYLLQLKSTLSEEEMLKTFRNIR